MHDDLPKEHIRQLTKAHLEEGLDECRWCFAVDLAPVKGILLARDEYPDGCLEYRHCPRCKGEYSVYVPLWGEDYVKERIVALHPNLSGQIDQELFDEVNDRVLYPSNLKDYLNE
jgi:hypothetical protein